MEKANEDRSLPRKAPRLVYPPVLEKKSTKPKPVLEYHQIEKKITSAITDFKAGKYTSLAEAGRAYGITERAEYFRLRARAAGRASKSDRLKNGSQRLSPEQEITLCQFADELEDVRALHRKIGEKAYSMLCEELTANDPLPRPLGKQWPARFLERHPGIMARRPKHLISQESGESGNETTSPIPREEAQTSETTNGEPQLLLGCQRFLEQPKEMHVTSSQTPAVCTASLDPSNALDITSGIVNVERSVSSPTATPPDRAPFGSSTTNSFLSAIKSSLAEQKMTFSSRLA